MSGCKHVVQHQQAEISPLHTDSGFTFKNHPGFMALTYGCGKHTLTVLHTAIFFFLLGQL